MKRLKNILKNHRIYIVAAAAVVVVFAVAAAAIAGSLAGGDGTAKKGTSEKKEISENTKRQDSEGETSLPEQLTEASYEEWLAAGMLAGISLRYTDIVLESVYLASETEMENFLDSRGVYVTFTTGGEEKIIHSLPLERERNTQGTADLYVVNLGYATFDEEAVPIQTLESCKQMEPDAFDALITQLELPSLYER